MECALGAEPVIWKNNLVRTIHTDRAGVTVPYVAMATTKPAANVMGA